MHYFLGAIAAVLSWFIIMALGSALEMSIQLADLNQIIAGQQITEPHALQATMTDIVIVQTTVMPTYIPAPITVTTVHEATKTIFLESLSTSEASPDVAEAASTQTVQISHVDRDESTQDMTK